MITRRTTAFLLLSSLSVAAQAPTSDARAAALQAVLDRAVADGKVPGVTAGLMFADGEALALAAGVADRAAKTPMRPNDRMLAGSVGKTFVAAVALALVHEEKLALEAKIAETLGKEPWFERLPNAAEVTLRQLLTHTSGIDRYEFKQAFAKALVGDPDKTWKPEELVAYVLGDKPRFAPGQGFCYADTNYILVGMLIERAVKGSLYDEVERRFLKPLELSGIVPVKGRVIERLAQGYAGHPNPFTPGDAVLVDGKFAINPQFEWAGGGFAATAIDLARWARALYGPQRAGSALAAEARAPQRETVAAAPLGRNARYGPGLMLVETPHGEALGHSGFFPGYTTEMLWFAAHDLAVAVQVNTSVPPRGRGPRAILYDLVKATIGGGKP